MENETIQTPGLEYSSDTIRTLDWKEHIRRRPGMYIGKLGDGSHSDDGIYVLLKEVLDNAIDEYMMGFGKQITVDINETSVIVRDFGRGIPLDKVKDVSSKIVLIEMAYAKPFFIIKEILLKIVQKKRQPKKTVH